MILQQSVWFASVPRRGAAALVAAVALSLLAARPVAAQSIRPEWAEQLSLANIGAGVVQGPSRVTQMALTDGPTADTRYLYMASDPLGLRRATYDLTTAGSLQGQFAQHWVNDRMVDPQGHATDGYFLHSQVTPSAASVRLYAATAGDANGDQVFNSTDFIEVLAIGEYEDGVPANSDWTEGDWDGNGDFDSSDIVEALQTGTYVAESHPVPEPASGLLLALGCLLVAARGLCRSRTRPACGNQNVIRRHPASYNATRAACDPAHTRAACDPAHTRAACGYGISLTTMRLPRTSMTCTRWPAAM